MIIEDLANRNITVDLRVFDPQDLAIGWEVKTIVENPDIFENFFSKYPPKLVECFDDYYLYLLTLKLISLSEAIPVLIQEEHKEKIAALSEAAGEAVKAVDTGSVIRFINCNIDEIFTAQVSKHDIRFVTLDLIAKYNTGIRKETFEYLCKQYNYLFIDRFDSFEAVFEREPDLFKSLFRSGRLEDINPYRLENVLDIWQHVLTKGKSYLKDTVTNNIPTLFGDIVSLAKSANIDNVMQVEGTVRKFHHFLQRIHSPLANEFAQYAKDIEKLLSQNILERGQSFKYKIPVEEIINEWKNIENWELRLLYLTHDHVETDGQVSFISRLDKKPDSKSSIMDLFSTNIPTDDYYTISHQQLLSINGSIGTGTIIGILREKDTLREYYSLILSAIEFISEQMHADSEGLEEDAEQLISMVQLIVDNHDAEPKVMHSFCYGAAMFTCAFLEKLLRSFYISLIKERQYVPINKVTLGELLNESNDDIVKIFGEDHLKGLSFFLMQTPQKSIGHNIRNNLAHWSNLSVNVLTPTFVARTLWLFTDILNTVFWHFLKGTTEGA